MSTLTPHHVLEVARAGDLDRHRRAPRRGRLRGAVAGGGRRRATALELVTKAWRIADGLFAFRAGEAVTGLARIALPDSGCGRVVELAQQARERARAEGDRDAEAAPLHLTAAGTRLGGDWLARELVECPQDAIRIVTEFFERALVPA